MDSSGRDIPIVEDDMGEGFMDPIDADENWEEKRQRKVWKREEQLRRKNKIADATRT